MERWQDVMGWAEGRCFFKLMYWKITNHSTWHIIACHTTRIWEFSFMRQLTPPPPDLSSWELHFRLRRFFPQSQQYQVWHMAIITKEITSNIIIIRFSLWYKTVIEVYLLWFLCPGRFYLTSAGTLEWWDAAEATGLGFVCFVFFNPCMLSANRVDLGF